MEIIRFDKAQLSAKHADCKDFKELVKKLESKVRLDGKVICAITLNGMRLSESDEARFAGAILNEIDTLEIAIEGTQTLVAETLMTLRDTLTRLQARTVRIAELIRENPSGPAQFEFSGLMEQTQFFTEALAALKPRAKLVSESATLWANAETSTQSMIRELLQAFSRSDFVLVADVLEYELFNLLEQWIGVLDHCDFD